ncbi:hypothetical protein HZC34_08590 [Candidatus Saganbacteria bacterium]|nr:hypothetical protein [Candidatus Saganbacteria bacterium]
MGEMKKCAIYICDNCKFEEQLPIEDLHKNHKFKEDDLSSYPKFECHGCHRFMITAKKFENLPAEWFPDITPEEYYKDF